MSAELEFPALPFSGWPPSETIPSDLQVVTEGGGQRTIFDPKLAWGIWSRRGVVEAGSKDFPLYRYFLAYPTGLDSERAGLGCFANPSVATPEDADPTATRWIGFCRRWGFGWAGIVNCIPWIATDPNDIPLDGRAEPDGWNRAIVTAALQNADVVVCGWGKVLGGECGVVRDMEQLIWNSGQIPRALRLNQDGSPAHPLYLPADLLPFAMAKRA